MARTKKTSRGAEAPEFDVALSFAGEDRTYVSAVAASLREMGIRVFYDQYEAATLWGKDLYEHLREVYSKRSRYAVLFVSKSYSRKLWTNHERKSAQARAFEENREYVLPVRFDKTEIPGLLSTVGYVDAAQYDPVALAQLIKKKVGYFPRIDFFPPKADALVRTMRAKGAEAKRVGALAYQLFHSMKLMTRAERRILAIAVSRSCPSNFPNEAHIDIAFLGRLMGTGKKAILQAFARIACLGFNARLVKHAKHGDRSLAHDQDVISIQYDPGAVSHPGNATDVLIGVFDCLGASHCEGCFIQDVENLDLSSLSTMTELPREH